MNQEVLFKQLDQLAENDFENMNIDFDQYIDNSLKHIGSTDPELRDELIFPFLATIAYESLIEDAKFNRISKTLIGDTHLLYKVDESDEDAVFTRTFSALALSAILHNHNERAFLTNLVEKEIVESIKQYMTSESDYRGFVKDKGWAHSVAHIADVVGTVAANKNVPSEEVVTLLRSLKDMYLNNAEVFTHNEDERISTAITKYVERPDFDQSLMIDWVQSIDKSKFKDEYPGDLYIRINSKQLLRSLYFKVKDLDSCDELILAITKQLKLF